MDSHSSIGRCSYTKRVRMLILRLVYVLLGETNNMADPKEVPRM